MDGRPGWWNRLVVWVEQTFAALKETKVRSFDETSTAATHQ